MVDDRRPKRTKIIIILSTINMLRIKSLDDRRGLHIVQTKSFPSNAECKMHIHLRVHYIQSDIDCKRKHSNLHSWSIN